MTRALVLHCRRIPQREATFTSTRPDGGARAGDSRRRVEAEEIADLVKDGALVLGEAPLPRLLVEVLFRRRQAGAPAGEDRRDALGELGPLAEDVLERRLVEAVALDVGQGDDGGAA